MVGSVSSKEVVFCFQLIRNTRGASRQAVVPGAGSGYRHFNDKHLPRVIKGL